MMKNRILVLALLALLVALFGCAAPKYQFCCFYDEAFPEDPADAVCMGMNASGEVETLSVVGCDEEDWSCTISIGLDGAEDVKVPVCPNIVTTKCNSSCVGVFCGNFFYDPRPSHGTIPSNEAHAAPDEGKSTEDSVTSEPVGLWQAECRVEEMTSLFMRQVENSGEITLNTFRFGIGDSFQDFEDAQLYFPLTDKACELNPTGTTDRYVVYAIPNRKSNGNPLCNLQTVQLSPPINENKVVNPGISFSGDASVLRVVDACTKHSDCLPGELCDLLSGVCIDACTQAQCTGGDVCIGGYCVPPAAGSECSTDGDCPDGEVCANGYCKWDLHLSGCTKNIDCPVGRVCYSGQCVDACSQAMCSEGTICIGGYCVPPAMGTECTSDSDCEIWEACANGYCKWNIYSDQNCYIDAHCQVGQECIEGECRAPCTSDSDCGTGWFCAGDGYCSEAPVECYYHSDCEPGEVCSGGYCILDMGDFDEPPELSEVYLPSEMYVCSASSAIKSYSYFDCASRCALQIYGYKAEIDPFNPYLSIYDGERIGNPFAYAPNRDSYSNDRYPNALYNGINFLEFYRDKVGPLEANDADAYAYGSVLYGATFGDPILSQDVDTKVDLLMLQYLASEGYVSSNDDSNKIPYLGKSSDYYFFDWNWDSQSFARNTFLTVENSPHEFYPWLLAHHSVYNEQFEDGHYSAGGTYSTGAEFECQTGMDCLSGYCNNFDYKRGVCVGVDGEDILCDCVYENGETLCTGMGTFETASWDNPGVDVEIPVALSAAVDETLIGPPLVSGGYNAPAYLPSFGRVVELSMGEGETLDAGAGSEEILKAPFFIMPLGGGHSSSYYGDLRLPDYTLRSWEGMGDSKVTKLLNTIDLCSAVYSGGKWSRTLDGTEYVFCCDGTISCDTVGEGETNKFVIPSSTTGEHMTRFVENCMGGYKEYISVCFSPDAKSQIGTWGWSGDSPIVNIIGGYKFLTGKDGDGKPIYEIIPFCRFIGEEALGEDDPDEIKGRRCYQWASGGHYPLGTEDTCVAEAESYLVIEPRRVEMEDGTVRWAYGNCLINSQGDGLELREYGICESCGYLTMAKEEITALPLESEMKFDGVSYDDEEMYGNTYCPDMVVHTPHNWFSIKERSNKDTGPFGNYVLAPTGMSGYNSYEFGSYEWGGRFTKNAHTPMDIQ